MNSNDVWNRIQTVLKRWSYELWLCKQKKQPASKEYSGKYLKYVCYPCKFRIGLWIGWRFVASYKLWEEVKLNGLIKVHIVTIQNFSVVSYPYSFKILFMGEALCKWAGIHRDNGICCHGRVHKPGSEMLMKVYWNSAIN